MNILNLCIRYWPAIGGAEYENKIIIEGLKQFGYNFIIYTSDLSDHVNNKKLVLSKEEHSLDKKNNIYRYSGIKFPSTVYHFFPKMIFDSLKYQNYDLIHSWTMMYFPALAGYFLKMLKKKPLILNAIVDDNNIKYRKLYSKTIARQIVKKADITVLLTEFSKKILYENGFNPKKIEIIPPGIFLNEYQGNFERSKFIEKSKINLLFVGRIAYGKGLDILVKAINLLKNENIKLNICGPDFGYKEKLQYYIEEYNIKDKINFCGNLSRKNLIELYNGSDMLILPSRYEAFGMVMIEAMASKTAVIAMNSSAIPYVIEDNKTGLLFGYEDFNDLKEKILELMNNKKLYNHLIENGLEEVKKNFCWNVIFDKYKSLYNKLL